MIVVGLDLAGKPENPTGYCVLTEVDSQKTVSTKLTFSDEEIITLLKNDKPNVVAIDAPLIYNGQKRLCDDILAVYGALPVTLPGMNYLASRGSKLKEKLDAESFKSIEVNNKSSGKILGVSHKDEYTYQKNLMGLDFDGDINERLLNKDELDSIISAITGYLFLDGQTEEVGDDQGQVIIPKI